MQHQRTHFISKESCSKVQKSILHAKLYKPLRKLYVTLSWHEMKFHSIYFLNECYQSYLEWFIHACLSIIFDLVIFHQNVSELNHPVKQQAERIRSFHSFSLVCRSHYGRKDLMILPFIATIRINVCFLLKLTPLCDYEHQMFGSNFCKTS